MKIGDIVSFKGMWIGIIEKVNEAVIEIEGNEGIFLRESFDLVPEITREHAKIIYKRGISLQNYPEKLARFAKQYENDAFGITIHRCIIDILKHEQDNELIKPLFELFLSKVESKIGKIN